MNVFILLITFLFMAGWYLMQSPSQSIAQHSIEYAERKTGVNSVLTCVAHVHAEAVKLDNELKINERVDIDNDTLCAEKYGLSTVKICVDGNRIVAACTPDRANRAVQNYIITSAEIPVGDNAGKALELLADEFQSNTNFGLFDIEGRSNVIIAGNGLKREIPATVAKEAELEPGQLVHITHYAVAGKPAFTNAKPTELVSCMPGQLQVFRFNRWQCVSVGSSNVCFGAMIWDNIRQECVPDDSRRPLCGAKQTPVMVDSNWECMDPVLQKTCPLGQSPHLDYVSMEWVCSINPDESQESKKCETAVRIRAGSGGTIKTTVASSCNDCEEMVTDPDTCESACVPSRANINSQHCYRGECSGSGKAFYFGFPNAMYTAAARKMLPELNGIEIQMGVVHSQNRKFNCLDCGERGIDTENSVPPWTAVCR
ncbi:MAG: hypothetical protein FWG80_01040 [Alphaproteobacteria bacterium]|nr:hypothetical protein [Alphaproteobacteria bacterium]